jgi:hypothetical protein
MAKMKAPKPIKAPKVKPFKGMVGKMPKPRSKPKKDVGNVTEDAANDIMQVFAGPSVGFTPPGSDSPMNISTKPPKKKKKL